MTEKTICKSCNQEMKCTDDSGSFTQKNMRWDHYECINCGTTLDVTVKNSREEYVWQLKEQPKQQFQVGEYYYHKRHGIYKIMKLFENDECELNLLDSKNCLGITYWKNYDAVSGRKATAEEVALFKRAEHFSNKGRKLNEFRANDLFKDKYGDLYLVEAVSNDGTIFDLTGDEMGKGENVTLIMTAEELAEKAKEAE